MASGARAQSNPASPIIRSDILAEVFGQARAEAARGEAPVAVIVVWWWSWLTPAQPGGAARQPADDVHVILKL
jgi:hypothetical protein